MKRPFFTTIEETLGTLFSGSEELRELWQLVRIRGAWEQLPEIIRANSAPLDFSGGVLTCSASSTVWVQELSLKRPQLKAHIGSIHPDAVPEQIRFVLKKIDPKRARPGITEQKRPPQAPRPGSPAWHTLREVRAQAREINAPWCQWFLDITEDFFIEPSDPSGSKPAGES